MPFYSLNITVKITATCCVAGDAEVDEKAPIFYE